MCECEYGWLVSPLILLLSQYFRLSSLQCLLLQLPLPHIESSLPCLFFSWFLVASPFSLPWLLFIVCFSISFSKWYFECKTITTMHRSIAPVDSTLYLFCAPCTTIFSVVLSPLLWILSIFYTWIICQHNRIPFIWYNVEECSIQIIYW